MDSVSQLEGKRITLKRSRPNPLFEECLEKLYEEAKAKKSKLESKLKEALDSLSKYPLPLKSGIECAVLKGFDKKLCIFLDKYIETSNYNREHYSEPCTSTDSPDETPVQSQSSKSSKGSSNKDMPLKSINTDSRNGSAEVQNQLNNSSDSEKSTKKTKSRKQYKPAFRSGSYAILIALLEQLKENPHKPSLQKDKLIEKAQPHSEESFTRPKPESFYTAWSNMSRLVAKGLVKSIRSKKTDYSLTDDGIALAIELLEDAKNQPTVNDIIFNGGSSTNTNVTTAAETVRFTGSNSSSSQSSQNTLITLSQRTVSDIISIELTPGSFDIILLIDKQETGGFDKATILARERRFIPRKVREAIEIQKHPNFNRDTGWGISPAWTPLITQRKNQVQHTARPTAQDTVSAFCVHPERYARHLRNRWRANNKKDPTVAQFNKYQDLKHEYRSLKVGDYTWIAKHKVHTDQELVLPYVVERKRMDDLGHSIKDGRFHEQKFRLRKCGLANVIYLVENFGSNKHVGLPIQSLMQALANTRVQDGFKVHITDSLTNTARFLAMMTKRLTIEYKDKHLVGSNTEPQEDKHKLMIFNYFNKSSTKNKPLTVTEIFIKLLLQLKGVSVEKALAITKVYSTPKSLINEYDKCSQKEGEALLANLKYGDLNRNVGPMVSKAIYKFFVWKT